MELRPYCTYLPCDSMFYLSSLERKAPHLHTWRHRWWGGMTRSSADVVASSWTGSRREGSHVVREGRRETPGSQPRSDKKPSAGERVSPVIRSRLHQCCLRLKAPRFILIVHVTSQQKQATSTYLPNARARRDFKCHVIRRYKLMAGQVATVHVSFLT